MEECDTGLVIRQALGRKLDQIPTSCLLCPFDEVPILPVSPSGDTDDAFSPPHKPCAAAAHACPVAAACGR